MYKLSKARRYFALAACLLTAACAGTSGVERNAPAAKPAGQTARLTDLKGADNDKISSVTTAALESGKLSARGLGLAYFKRGSAWYAKGRLNRAVSDYTAALKADPGLTAAYANRGDSHARQKNHQAAIDDFNKFLAAHPSEPKVYFKRGVSHYKLKQYDQAVGDFTKAVSLDPEYGRAYLNRGVALTAQGEYNKALKDLDRFLKKHPQDETALKTKEFIQKQMEELAKNPNRFSATNASNGAGRNKGR
jgi:tetratricopeptide (TPR) repeat protein